MLRASTQTNIGCAQHMDMAFAELRDGVGCSAGVGRGDSLVHRQRPLAKDITGERLIRLIQAVLAKLSGDVIFCRTAGITTEC